MLLRRLSHLWPDQALDGADPLLEATLGRRAEARLQPIDTPLRSWGRSRP